MTVFIVTQPRAGGDQQAQMTELAEVSVQITERESAGGEEAGRLELDMRNRDP